MKKKLYKPSEVVAITGVTMRELIDMVEKGLIIPAYQPPKRKRKKKKKEKEE